jgi:hypothetical protein
LAEENQAKKRSNFADMTPEKHKQLSSIGGKKSVEARRRKRDLRESTDLLLSLKVKDPKLKQEMLDGGIKKGDLDNQMALVFKQFIKALAGSTRAAEFLADALGERNKPEKETLKDLDEQDDPITISIKQMLGVQDQKDSE